MAEIYPIEPYLTYTPIKRHEGMLLSIEEPIPEMMVYFRECRESLTLAEKQRNTKAAIEISEILGNMREQLLTISKGNALIKVRKLLEPPL